MRSQTGFVYGARIALSGFLWYMYASLYTYRSEYEKQRLCCRLCVYADDGSVLVSFVTLPKEDAFAIVLIISIIRNPLPIVDPQINRTR